MQLYNLIEGKTANSGRTIMTDSLPKVRNRCKQLQKGSVKKGFYKRGPFWIVKADENSEKGRVSPDTRWYNYNKNQPERI